LFQHPFQPFPLEMVKEPLDVRFYNKVVSAKVQFLGQGSDCVVGADSRPIPVAARQKVLFVDRQQDLRHCHLHQLIFQYWNAQGAQLPSALGDVLPSHQPRSIRLAFESPFQVHQVGLQVPFVILEAHPVHATRCVLPQAVET
jgi:hypothetical protein